MVLATTGVPKNTSSLHLTAAAKAVFISVTKSISSTMYPSLPRTVRAPSVYWHMLGASEPPYFLDRQYYHYRHGSPVLIHRRCPQLLTPGHTRTLSPKACQDSLSLC